MSTLRPYSLAVSKPHVITLAECEAFQVETQEQGKDLHLVKGLEEVVEKRRDEGNSLS